MKVLGPRGTLQNPVTLFTNLHPIWHNHSNTDCQWSLCEHISEHFVYTAFDCAVFVWSSWVHRLYIGLLQSWTISCCSAALLVFTMIFLQGSRSGSGSWIMTGCKWQSPFPFPCGHWGAGNQAYLQRGCVVSWGPTVLIPLQEITKDCMRASLCMCVCLRERDRETERDVADRVSYWFPSCSVSVDLMGDLKTSGQCVHLRISVCAGVLNSANHAYEHIYIFFMLLLYISSGYIFYVMLCIECCTYDLVRFMHNNRWVRVRERSLF